MKVDLLRTGIWERACEQISPLVPLTNPRQQVRIYRGVAHALFELGQSAALLSPAKKSIACISATGPDFDTFLRAQAAQGAHLITGDLKCLEHFKDWVSSHADETFLFAWCADDCVTGRIYDDGSLLQAFDSKRLFHVRVHHHLSVCQYSGPLSPYRIEIFSLAPDLCLALVGERVRLLDTLAPGMFWPTDLAGRVSSLISPAERGAENRDLVERFEKNLPCDLNPFFINNEARFYDRAVVFWSDINGEAAQAELAELLNIDLKPAGFETLLETASLCRWDQFAGFKWLLNQGYDPHVLRGLLVINQSLINDKLVAAIERTHEKILKMQ